jgi:hypothetical protein
MSDHMGSPHLQFSPTLLIAYHCVLFYGSSIDSELYLAGQTAKLIYSKLCSLTRYWKYSIPATSLDILTCLLLVQIPFSSTPQSASQLIVPRTDALSVPLQSDIMVVFMDMESSSFYFNETCRLASVLDNSCADTVNDCSPRESSNLWSHPESRRYLVWELIQKDCCFKLVLDKPSAIPFPRPGFEFPGLSCEALGTPNADVKQLYFVVSMRIIFATLELWSPRTSSSSDLPGHSDGHESFEAAQGEIASILESWEVVRGNLPSILDLHKIYS